MTVRCLVPAIFGVLFFCYSALAENVQTVGKETPAEFSVPVRITVSEEEKKSQARLLEEAREHNKSELDAQWKSAYAAESSAYYSFISSVISGIVVVTSILASAFTIYQANRSTEIARSIGQAQVRAYISVKSIQLHWKETPNGMQIGNVRVTLKNYGTSPARNMRALATYVIIPLNKSGDRIDQFDQLRINEKNASLSLLPGDVVHIGHDAHDSGRWAGIKDTTGFAQGKNAILVFCLVEYYDVFGVRHETRYCNEALYTSINETEHKIIYRTYEHHNSDY